MPVCVDRVNVRFGGLKLRQHRNKPTAGKMFLNVPLSTHEDAVALERPADGDLAVVRREIAADLDSVGALLRTTPRGETPDAVRIVPLPDPDAVMPGELARGVGNSMRRDVFR